MQYGGVHNQISATPPSRRHMAPAGLSHHASTLHRSREGITKNRSNDDFCALW